MSSSLSSSSSSSSLSVELSNELKSLAHGPLNAYVYTACIVNGVRFVVHSRDIRRTTQNSGVVTIGEDGTHFYGQLEEIVELNYVNSYSVVVFRCKWFNTSGKRLVKKNNIIAIDISHEWFVNEQYILATQAKQVFYLQDPSRTTGNWRVVENVHHRKLWDHPSMIGANEVDVLHDNQSSDYNLVVNDELNVSQETQDFCDLVVDLGPLPMRAPLDEGVNVQIFIDDDEVEYDDEEEEEDEEEDEDEEDDDDDEIEKHYCSDDSE
ncbi:hypothetical protein R6Q59_006182 [Mikania micrantha]